MTEGITRINQSIVKPVWDWTDSYAIVRVVVLVVTLYVTIESVERAWEFGLLALAHKYNGVETAAVIAAVLIPVSALQGFAFNMWRSSKSTQN